MPYDPNPPDPNDPLADLSRNHYAYNSFMYPLDLASGTSGYDHYVVFHVSENSSTQYATSTVGGQAPTDKPTINQNVQNDFSLGIASTQLQNISRVATTIVLPMPPHIESTYGTDWGETELGAAEDIFGKETSLANVLKSLGADAVRHAGHNLSHHLNSNSKGFTELDFGTAIGYQMRLAVNNHREVLFNGVAFRTFNFTFRFVPQSEAEATNVRNIIQAFRFYQAPEIVRSTAGRFMLYPSEFDIQFYSNGQENLWLNRISTCALTESSVNYTPTGQWSAHRQAPDGTAPGVCTELSLTFQELELIDKQRVLQNF